MSKALRTATALLAVSLAAFALLQPMAMPLATARAQSPSWFSVTLKYPYLIISDSLFYWINISLKDGARASYWYVNVSKPQLVNVVPPASLEYPVPMISISRPNSTAAPLPSPLSSVSWNATIVESTPYSTTIKLFPLNETAIAPFLVTVYVTVSPLAPYLRYTISVTNVGPVPAWATITYVAGSAPAAPSSWKAAAELMRPNGSVEVVGLENGSAVSGYIISALEADVEEGSSGIAIGVSPLTEPASVELMQGTLFGLSSNQSYLALSYNTSLIRPGGTYNVTFDVYSLWLSPVTLMSVDAAQAAEYVYPGFSSLIPQVVAYNDTISALSSEVSALSAEVDSLRNETNNLSARLYYVEVQLKNSERTASYYMRIAHRSGVMAAGFFVAGIVVGLLGGAYLLSPTARETLARRGAPARAGAGRQPKK